MAKKYNSKHPWNKWLSKRRIRLRRGVDFNGMPHAMAVQVRNAAKQRGIVVSVAVEDDAITVEVKGRDR